MSSNLELLRFPHIELNFPDQVSDRPCLEDLTIAEADDVHAGDDILA